MIRAYPPCYGVLYSGTVLGSGAQGTFRFGPFELDVDTRELRKRGIRVQLQEQPFRILQTLLEKPGEIVVREDLVSRLWPECTFVDFDRSLNAAIGRLRQALGDSAETPRFIETVARRGYRFIAVVSSSRNDLPSSEAPLELPRNEPARSTPPRRWSLAAIMCVASLGLVVFLLVLHPASSALVRGSETGRI